MSSALAEAYWYRYWTDDLGMGICSVLESVECWYGSVVVFALRTLGQVVCGGSVQDLSIRMSAFYGQL